VNTATTSLFNFHCHAHLVVHAAGDTFLFIQSSPVAFVAVCHHCPFLPICLRQVSHSSLNVAITRHSERAGPTIFQLQDGFQRPILCIRRRFRGMDHPYDPQISAIRLRADGRRSLRHRPQQCAQARRRRRFKMGGSYPVSGRKSVLKRSCQVYAEVVAGLSALTSIIYMVPLLKSFYLFAWDIVLL